VLSGRGLSDELNHSSRGVLKTVVRRCVCSRNLVNEEALVHCGLLRVYIYIYIYKQGNPL